MFRPIWSNEQIAYLREHYPTEGAAIIAQHLPFTHTQIQGKANRLGIHLTKEATYRIVHEAARKHMTEHNPMFNPETVEKVRQWGKDHPEEHAQMLQRMAEGKQKIQRDKPSGLEYKLRSMLDDLGVSYEPSFLVKPKFIVDIKIGGLIIEADGDYWHGHPRLEPLTKRQQAQQRRDRARDIYLTTCGYTVVRIWESDLCWDKLISILQEHAVPMPNLAGLDPATLR